MCIRDRFKGCTTVLFEGKPVGTPDAGAFWKIISDYKVKSLFNATTDFRAIKSRYSENLILKYVAQIHPLLMFSEQRLIAE